MDAVYCVRTVGPHFTGTMYMIEYKLRDFAVSPLNLMVWTQSGSSNEYVELHRHNCYEMMYIIKGAGVCHINGKPYTATRGDLFVMSYSDTHKFVKERDFFYFNIMFTPELFTPEELDGLKKFPVFAEWLQPTADTARKYQFMPPYCDHMEEHVRTVAEEFKYRAPGFELSARAAFLRFLIFTLRHLDYIRRLQGTSVHESAVARVIHYINQHYHENLTMKTLANYAGVSEALLSKIFKKETGDSVFDYIGKIRIGNAQFELEHTAKSISQIAVEMGYYDSSYFSRAFRRYAGFSPREYRIMQQAKNR